MNNRIFSALFFVTCLALLPTTGYCQDPQMPQQYPQQMPMQQMQQVPPGPLNGMWAANNGQAFAMFMGNQYLIVNQQQQPMEGGTFALTGNEMTTQVIQGQGAGQQMRYSFQPGPDGRSFTLTMQNGSGSISYQKMQDLPQQMPMQPMPQGGQQYPQQPMPQGGQQYPQQPMPQGQQYPQQPMPQGQQYPQQPMPQGQQYPQMQPMPQLPRQ